uniref:Uncharacterized protein n=1 Tax=Aegilops tauschii subsp. strangulata TaxID=200361 RepID=A0A453LJQ9_AEGTS
GGGVETRRHRRATRAWGASGPDGARNSRRRSGRGDGLVDVQPPGDYDEPDHFINLVLKLEASSVGWKLGRAPGSSPASLHPPARYMESSIQHASGA